METIQVIFLQVLKMSLTASFIIPFILILRMLLKRCPKIFSYALWSVIFFRLLCPVSFQADFSIFQGIRALQHPMAVSFDSSNDVDRPTSKLYDTNTPELTATETHIPGNTFSDASIHSEPDVSNSPKEDFFASVCSLLWLSVTIFLFILNSVRYWMLKNRLATAIRVGDHIYESSAISTPFVCGLFHPCIYLPLHLNAEDSGFILLHEQAHIRQLDHLTKPLAFYACCLHWFNPLVWMCFHLMTKDIEMSCDERVLKTLHHAPDAANQKKEYCSALLHFSVKAPYKSTQLRFGEPPVKQRIKNILQYKKRKASTLILLFTICLMTIAACAANPSSDRAQSNTPKGEDSSKITPDAIPSDTTSDAATSKPVIALDIQNTAFQKLIKDSLISYNKDEYIPGEYATAAYTFYGSDSSKNHLTLYIKYDFSYYGFINGCFTDCSGCSSIPAVLSFENKGTDEQPDIQLSGLTIASDGSDYIPSIHRFFPSELWDTITDYSEDDYMERRNAMDRDAQNYLDQQGRGQKVGVIDTSPLPFSKNVEKILCSEFPDYPDWIGNVAKYDEDGRYCSYTVDVTNLGQNAHSVSYLKTDYNTHEEQEHYDLLINEAQGLIVFIDNKKELSSETLLQSAVQILYGTSLIGYIKDCDQISKNGTITIETVRFLSNAKKEDQERIKELGLTDDDFSNDYYIDNADSKTVVYPLHPDMFYIILREHMYEDQLVDAKTFIAHTSEYTDTIPYRFVIVDEQIIAAKELYVP